MTRTPFIAGNWKMNKTVAEAERYIQALLPQVAAVDGVEIVVCPPFLALGALVDSARGSQVGIYAQNMHEADTGRTPARCPPRCWASSTSRASCSATPSGASTSTRPTRRSS